MSRAARRAVIAVVAAALAGCSLWPGTSGGADHAAPSTAAGTAWRSAGVSFVLPAGWVVYAGPALGTTTEVQAPISAISSLSGLDPADVTSALAGYDEVALGPGTGIVLITTPQQSDLDGTSKASVTTYLNALCRRQPTRCEHLVSFGERATAQGNAVVYVTVGGGGYYSGSVVLPYVDRGVTNATPQGRQVAVASTSEAVVERCIDALIGSLHQF